MHRSWHIALAVLPLLVVNSPAVAEVTGYKFKGSVLPLTASPWQIPIASFGPSITGAFIYDTDSAPTHVLGDCDCVGYRQQRLNGFFAKSGSVSVRADDYVMEVLNDAPQGASPDADIVSVRFSSNFAPPLELPLVVDSAPQTVGTFSVNFVGSAGLFSTSALPTSLSLTSFQTRLGFLSDTPDGVMDVTFVITSLTRVDLLPGDYDFDNDVDEADYNKWTSTYASTGELIADGNHDGVVDAADYTVWRNAMAPPVLELLSTSIAVPEPGAGMCLLIGWFWLFPGRTRQLGVPVILRR